jgi:hypothetical protein
MAKIRHQELLQEIREQHERSEISGGYPEASGNSLQPAQRPAQGADRIDEVTRRTDASTSRAFLGLNQLNGGNDRPGQHESESAGSGIAQNPGPGERELTPLEKAAEEDRKKELQRARQRRYEERKKQKEAEQQEQAQFSDVSELENASTRHSHSQVAPDGGAKKKAIFTDTTKKADVEVKSKQPKKDYSDVKLLTNADAVEKREKLIDLYIRGSSFIDKALQIIVKGHEEVHIWELSEFEAGMLVDLQLEKAKKDKAAAALVNQLVDIHERLFIFSLASGRVVATGVHVASKGGLGFR